MVASLIWFFHSCMGKYQGRSVLLRSESPSGKCAKLHTRPITSLGYQGGRRVFWEGPTFFKLCPTISPRGVKNFVGDWLRACFTLAASSNKDHLMRSLCYCLFAPHIYGCYSSRTSRSWWIAHSTQCRPRGCNNIPPFLQRTAPITRSFCEGCTWHDLHILVTAPFCCDRKARAANAQSFTLWQEAAIEITLIVTISKYYQLFTSIIGDRSPRSLCYCLFVPHIYGCYSSRTSGSWWVAHSTQRQPRGYRSTMVWKLAKVKTNKKHLQTAKNNDSKKFDTKTPKVTKQKI